MNPPRPVINLRDRNWRSQMKAALDQILAEPVPQNIDATLKGLK